MVGASWSWRSSRSRSMAWIWTTWACHERRPGRLYAGVRRDGVVGQRGRGRRPAGAGPGGHPSLLAPHTLAEMREDCDGFRALAGDLLDAFDQRRVAGDFWLTRNR